ncbi:major facilitator superfamily domain-containing protein [Infundibulicybe gibba]|nr:major facilitator superfamily domain-containing protein [Infundibulicybe gibba]
MDSASNPSSTTVDVDPAPANLQPGPLVAPWRAWTLLLIFSMAQMIDVFNVTAPTVALPSIASDLDVKFEERQWAINAYSLTFGAFLLMGGRFSAIYGPKILFVVGFFSTGICGIISGFSTNGPMLFVFRAIQGVGAAMTIPSALSMITTLFPGRGEQDRALGVYAGFGAMGSVCGLVLGGVISQLLTWRWIFWILAMVIIPLALIAFLLAPSTTKESRGDAKLANMDWIGLCTITLSLILFIYSVTEGNSRGWTSGGILAPLIISIALLPTFGYVETKVAEPLIPPAVWTLPEFVPLFFITLSEYLVMNVIIYQESVVFQQVWLVPALGAAIRIIPFGIAGFFVTISMGWVTPHVPPRWILFFGQLLMLAGAVLVAFAPDKSQYWSHVLPALVLEALGIASGFVAANIAMIRTPLAKPSVRLHDSTALIGAIFNADLQIGSTIGLAIATAITSRVNGQTDSNNFAGYKASFWFLVGITAVEAILAAVALKGWDKAKVENVESTIVEEVQDKDKIKESSS